MVRGAEIGWLYFIESAAQGATKIGYAADVAQRLASLQSGNPDPLKLRHVLRAVPAAEKALHRKLKANRMVREWYPSMLAEAIYDELADNLWDDLAETISVADPIFLPTLYQRPVLTSHLGSLPDLIEEWGTSPSPETVA